MKLEWKYIGTVPYTKAMSIQQATHERVRNGSQAPTVLCMEHEPVITVGKNTASYENMILDKQVQPLIQQTDRGGVLTVHMPGQLIMYPILPLESFKLSVRHLVQSLEQTVIAALSELQIKAHTKKGSPGVWVNNSKICSIGLRIKHRTSMHGIALNVHNSLDLFRSIVSCGDATTQMTSVQLLAERKIECYNMAKICMMHLSRLLEAEPEERHG